jgi:tRNA-Thr(GGU) m(6)t(6)A37 methyltransferase TsaA
MEIVYRPIGIIHSPFHDLAEMPVQPGEDLRAPGTVEVFEEFEAGLKDLEGFSHIILIYHFHQVLGGRLLVTPFLDTQTRGVFATRAPTRPNPIGLSIVRLVSIQGNILSVDHLDTLDGTPLLDIKPYIPAIEPQEDIRIGWIEEAREKFNHKRSDDRFK